MLALVVALGRMARFKALSRLSSSPTRMGALSWGELVRAFQSAVAHELFSDLNDEYFSEAEQE